MSGPTARSPRSPTTTPRSPSCRGRRPAGQLAPCSAELSRPRPALVAGTVTFFAANWPAGRAGIFAYDIATGQLAQPYLASNSDGYFTGGQFSQPTAGLSAAVFTASGPAGGPAPGLYSVPISGGSGTPAQLLDITTATTPSGKQIANIGNAQVRPLLPASELVVYGQHADGNEAIFAVQGGALKTLVPEGQTVGGYPIASGAGTFWTELAFSGSLLAFNCQLSPGGGGILAGLIAMPQTSPPGDLVMIANASQTIPGGNGTFDGNEFATPPVCDGTRVVFTGMYFPTQGFGETFGLFVWNATTGLSAKVLDSNTMIGTRQISNMYLHDGGFVDGKLAASVLFADQSSGIYLFDLSGY